MNSWTYEISASLVIHTDFMYKRCRLIDEDGQCRHSLVAFACSSWFSLIMKAPQAN